MTEEKQFDTYLVASFLTGVAMGPMSFSDMKEVGSWLFSASLLTHELAHEPTMDIATQEGLNQFPDMPTCEDAEQSWESALDIAIKNYGHFVTVKRGTHGRIEDPETTLINMVGKDKIITIRS